MRIVRFIDASGEVQFAYERGENAFRLDLPDGDLFGRRVETEKPAAIRKRLAAQLLAGSSKGTFRIRKFWESDQKLFSRR